jgi:hypothetical protein
MRLCRPAPVVAMKLPIKMTHSFGHAKLATTKLPPTLCPNLYCNKEKRKKKKEKRKKKKKKRH